MNTTRLLVIFLSLGLAIKVFLVFSPVVTVLEPASSATSSSPFAVSIAALEESLLDKTSTHKTGENSIRPTAELTVFKITESDDDTDALQSPADRELEQLYDLIWQAVETNSIDNAEFQELALSALDERHYRAPGKILAEIIRTAPTTDMQVDALRMLAEVSQELSVSPSSLKSDESDAEIRQLTKELFDEFTVGSLLDAVAEVVQNGNQRERLAALSTLEEMHQFAPIWEVAYSVLNDPDPQIRMRALELLTYGNRQLATDQLLIALSDPNLDISELAEKLLTGLEETPS